MFSDNKFVHTRAVIVETHPMIFITVDPLADLDWPDVKKFMASRAFQVLTQSTGIDRILKKLPHKYERRLIEIFTHQELQNVVLVERKTIFSVSISVTAYVVA